MNEVIIFNFEQKQVRSLMIEGQPYFVGKDVALILGYSKPQNAILRHCKGALKRGILTNGGNQELLVIPESDMYRLAIHSRLPEAERFERWVMEDVLPSIRKTGGYGTVSSGHIPVDVLEYIDLLKTKIVVLSQPKSKKQSRRILSVERLGQETVLYIKQLRHEGRTISEIYLLLNHTVSRSALGRFFQRLESGV